jgi:hypothetical protein
MKRDEAVEHYYSLKPLCYSILVKLELNQIIVDGKTPELEVNIVLRSNQQHDYRCLYLVFNGVTEIKFKQPQLSLFSIASITIDCIKYYQWEDVFYKVIDDEDESLSFYCKHFEATLKNE